MLLFISWKWHTGTEGDWGGGGGEIFFSNVLHQPGHLPRKAPARGAAGREEGQAAGERMQERHWRVPYPHPKAEVSFAQSWAQTLHKDMLEVKQYFNTVICSFSFFFLSLFFTKKKKKRGKLKYKSIYFK